MFISIFLHVFISFKYDFHVDAERMIVKTKKYRSRWLKKKRIARYLFRREELTIFVAYGQLN